MNGKTKNDSFCGFSVCACLCVCAQQRQNWVKKKILQELENGQAGQGNVSTACLVVGRIFEILQFPRRPTSLLYLYVVFCMPYFTQWNRVPSVTGIQTQLFPILLLQTPVVEDCQTWIRRAQTKLCFYFFFLKIFFQRNQNFKTWNICLLS